jgi:hypothetical protein
MRAPQPRHFARPVTARSITEGMANFNFEVRTLNFELQTE